MNREIKFKLYDKHTNRQVSEPACYYMSVNDDGSMSIMNNIYVCGFTGLHDKNGKEIYEGDWCRAEFRTKENIQVIQGKIIMDEFMWCIDCTDSIGDDVFSINRPHNFEVLGNIYENPELCNP